MEFKEKLKEYQLIVNNELERYNIYNLRMLVRHDKDGKSYLYDFLRTKKETSSPLQ